MRWAAPELESFGEEPEAKNARWRRVRDQPRASFSAASIRQEPQPDPRRPPQQSQSPGQVCVMLAALAYGLRAALHSE